MLGEIYRAATVVEAASGTAAIKRLGQILAPTQSELTPALVLVKGQLRRRNFAEAKK